MFRLHIDKFREGTFFVFEAFKLSRCANNQLWMFLSSLFDIVIHPSAVIIKFING